MILINSIENNLGILGEKKLINKWKNIISSNIDYNINNNIINNVNNINQKNDKKDKTCSPTKSNNDNINKKI